ncbi:MAG: hypothetical protein R3C05_11985 [Pirellulaceae bacterium]
MLGKHLLKKSIDRLQTLLFIEPDNLVAAYALAFCFHHDFDGIVNRQRAVELVHRVYEHDPEGDLGARALHLLAWIGRHHSLGVNQKVSADLSRMSYENIRFAFEKDAAVSDLSWNTSYGCSILAAWN